MVKEIFQHDVVEIVSLDEKNVFKVKEQRLKACYKDKDRIKISMDLMSKAFMKITLNALIRLYFIA